ncbi:class I SAM-dependent methyltransferase [Paraclostridium sordellii]|uniref:class I SAM-dependent methyltransferase n=1 Tax=Paraclostridium sordellii TaxID=1505 RepID=UPI0005DBBC88|nr:class I SAM-dependent methyltransferase [Paeniclostridium sordellii]QYE96745.1 class I SAM-dependent methyltransferase [Paeniclostridium sordellii]CEO09553.1 rRNA methylase [[Clostridium] sordellii] [Paeniclostridium sordellii]CEP87578.1 rRNA methylase [[Clostridium] sordellii] [Paeniclostridium sordellii]CEP95914.1 rRNA methylase [[Clostridium] sordellii] [Paeniclostridium sordellii]CEP98742.1 rRNA methylase [[Clostridium] sordellii] [Paeniclostridium sordellii]
MSKAKYLTKVTDLNKVLLEDVIELGDIVIDATMGNGYDTKYLAEKVGENGLVYSFDVQEEAIKSTRKKLEKSQLIDRVKLILDGHENMDSYITEGVSCVLFNLGYLPRAKHQIITKPDTTIKAIEKSLEVLKPHGVVSIAIYTGHEGGMDEFNAVFEYVKNLDQTKFNVLNCNFVNQINNPPRLVLIEKKKEY